MSVLLSVTMQLSKLRAGAGERGQSTAEYALVLVGVGTIAMLIIAWTAKTNRVGQLLDAVFKSLTGLVA
ncbi:MAG: hypothetical protein OEU32_03865 [Acidimicrobiia bacterium]|nr:hypothetical protein [Acidimicrobiia bacterium]